MTDHVQRCCRVLVSLSSNFAAYLRTIARLHLSNPCCHRRLPPISFQLSRSACFSRKIGDTMAMHKVFSLRDCIRIAGLWTREGTSVRFRLLQGTLADQVCGVVKMQRGHRFRWGFLRHINYDYVLLYCTPVFCFCDVIHLLFSTPVLHSWVHVAGAHGVTREEGHHGIFFFSFHQT